jgi:transcription antitermination factor NusG
MASAVLLLLSRKAVLKISGGTLVAVACLPGRKEAMNPERPAAPALNAEGPMWFALYVRAQRERVVADHLLGKGYELFLPTHKSRKRWSDRIKEVEAPLFPGYVFCQFDPQNRLPILTTPWVIQIVGYKHSPIPVDQTEIAAIRTLVASGRPSQPWPYMKIGERVRIESGPLRGLEGILTEFKGNHRLVVSVTLLQRSVSVEIDGAFVSSEARTQAHRSGNFYSKARPIQVAV